VGNLTVGLAILVPIVINILPDYLGAKLGLGMVE
jgi:hypothetical protein